MVLQNQILSILALSSTLFTCAGLIQERPISVHPVELSEEYLTGDQVMGARLCGTLDLSSAIQNGYSLNGLSGLAWNASENVLYALSDYGVLFYLKPFFEKERLVNVELLGAYPLQDPSGKRLKSDDRDSEGLSFRHDSSGKPQLLVSFEERPRISAYTTTGVFLEDIPLPEVLRDVKHYRGPNQALETVTIHPDWGILTGPEWPLRSADPTQFSLYSLGGKNWTFPRGNAPQNALVDMTVLPDGSLITLERAFVSYFKPMLITLRRVFLTAESAEVREIVVFDTTRGWRIDNFEGLTSLGDGRLLIVSDDNNNPLQRTLLMCLKIDSPL
ncbi:conserved hypothetical protein [Gammaproteobacteria bacterium]